MTDSQRLILADRIAEAIVIVALALIAHVFIVHNDEPIKEQKIYVKKLEAVLARCLQQG